MHSGNQTLFITHHYFQRRSRSVRSAASYCEDGTDSLIPSENRTTPEEYHMTLQNYGQIPLRYPSRRPVADRLELSRRVQIARACRTPVRGWSATSSRVG